jgi:cytochrome P450
VVQEARRVLGDGLLTSEGDHHRRQRRMIQPAFHRSRLESYGAVMAEEAERRSERWRDGDVVDVHREMSELTLASPAARCSAPTSASAPPPGGRCARRRAGHVRVAGSAGVAAHRAPPDQRDAPLRAAQRTLDDVVYGMIAERRPLPAGTTSCPCSSRRPTRRPRRPMTDRQVRDEA